MSTGCHDAGGTWLAMGRVNARAYCVDAPRRDVVDTRTREGRIAENIDRAARGGYLPLNAAIRARSELDSIRRSDDVMRRPMGRLSVRNEAILQSGLDRLSQTVNFGRP